uniref:RIIa domain-containing protein n=1 Tax=Palpitomonas bilix TaxID=652834 RepID=A0A7S3D6L4_9EUKA|mmetsp:Transcript_24511/g.62062  ORF Transcript_24511/g.62062 Transcript_24511/m.62062 type:complete len:251 (+) Transcript_24511:228-980(+)
MDSDVLYCAEQINVPSDLGAILKQYTKDVIRANPNNVLEYSAQYFERLTAEAQEVSQEPSHERQLFSLKEQLEALDLNSTGQLSKSEIQTAAVRAQIPLDTPEKIYSLAGIDSAAVEWRPFVVLAATIWAEDLNEVVRLIFSVFDEDSGGMSLTPSRFEELYSALGVVDESVKSHLPILNKYLANFGGRFSLRDFEEFVMKLEEDPAVVVNRKPIEAGAGEEGEEEGEEVKEGATEEEKEGEATEANASE